MELSSLPLDLLRHISSYLDATSLMYCIHLNKKLRISFTSLKDISLRRLYQRSEIPVVTWSKLLQPLILLISDNSVYLFEVSTKEFTECPPMAAKRFTRYYFNAVATPGRTVFTFASPFNGTLGALEQYSLFSVSWSSLPCEDPLPCLVGSAICYYPPQHCIYITGGYNNQEVNHIYRIDLYTRRCQLLQSSLATARDGHAAIIFHHRLYIAGGFSHHHNVASVECYNLHTCRWDPCSAMNKARYFCTLLVVGDALYVVGGDDAETIERYDADTDEWRIVASVKDRRTLASVCAVGSVIYFFGGSSVYFQEDATWDAYDVSERRWVSEDLAASRALPLTHCSNGCAVLLAPFTLSLG